MTNRKPLEGNILLVSNYPSDTAYAWWLMEQLWITLAKTWVSQGQKAYLAYPEVRTLSDAVHGASELEVVELTVPGETPEDREAFSAFVRDHNIKTVYFTDRPWFSSAHFAVRRAGVETILLHDHTPGDRPPIRGWRRLIKGLRNRLPLLTADYVFCVSPLMRQRNIDNGCLPPARCLVAQNGIPPLVQSSSRPELRQQLGLPDDAVVVITTGRAHPYKRFDFVIRTAQQIKERGAPIDIRFLLVGDGPAMEELRQLVADYGLEESVQLLGYRPDAQQLLFAADIAMHAALGEGFSLSIVEYMSAGLPVLVPDIPSVAQAITHDETGFVYPSNDVEAASRQIMALATNRELSVAMGSAGRARAVNEYSLERCLHDLESELHTLYSMDHSSSLKADVTAVE